MQSTTAEHSPELAPPGAGLPKVELFFARLLFHWTRKRTSREQATVKFTRCRDEILALVRGCDAVSGARRVLISRLPGLEDSSRYWSVFMTLDHLRIVNDAVAGAIGALVAGQVPPRVASTATVKPDADVDLTAVAAFEESCRRFEQCVAAAPDLRTEVKYAHPWFGPLDAAGWHVMAGFHLNLHRKQIEAILR